jgi:hypothetical protein
MDFRSLNHQETPLILRLFEELFVSHFHAYPNKPMLAEIKNLKQLRILACLNLFLKPYSACLYSNFNRATICLFVDRTQDLSQHILRAHPNPQLNLPLSCHLDFLSAPEFNYNLVPSRKLLVTPLHGVSL